MEARFTILGKLAGENDYRKATRKRFVGHFLKKAEQKKCQESIKAANIPAFTTPVGLSISWIDPDRRRDIDNISSGGIKPLLDALVKLKKIPNDGQRWVRYIEHLFPEPDKNNPRIEVRITEVVG